MAWARASTSRKVKGIIPLEVTLLRQLSAGCGIWGRPTESIPIKPEGRSVASPAIPNYHNSVTGQGSYPREKIPAGGICRSYSAIKEEEGAGPKWSLSINCNSE